MARVSSPPPELQALCEQAFERLLPKAERVQKPPPLQQGIFQVRSPSLMPERATDPTYDEVLLFIRPTDQVTIQIKRFPPDRDVNWRFEFCDPACDFRADFGGKRTPYIATWEEPRPPRSQIPPFSDIEEDQLKEVLRQLREVLGEPD